MLTGKILFLSHFDAGARGDIGGAYMREFVKNGALFLDCSEIYLECGHSGSQAFIKDFIDRNGIEILLYAVDPVSFYLPPDFFRGLRGRVFTVMLAGDTVYYFDARDKHYAGAMDLFVVYDSFKKAQAFRELGGDSIMFLSAFDRKRYFRSSRPEKTIDVSFVGCLAGRKDRAAYIDYLVNNGVDVRVFGYGAPGGQVALDQMVEIFNKTRINLNFTGASALTHLRGANVPPGTRQLKGRVVEPAICGSFVLTETAPGIELVLRPEEEMAIFSTEKELLEKVKFYLSNEQVREAIAEKGYQRAIKDYDLSLSVPRLLAEIEARRLSNKRYFAEILPDAAFETNFASYRMLYIIKFLKHFRFAFALEELKVIIKIRKIDLAQLYTFIMQELVDKFPKTKTFLKGCISGQND